MGHASHHSAFDRAGRRGRRVFEQGDLRWVVLQLIAEQGRHGYEIIKNIEERLGGGYSPSPGVIYPTLTLLEELGFVTVASAVAGRKLYEITAEGRAQLQANQSSVEALFEKMKHIRDRRGEAYPPPVARAIENLLTALRLKLEHAPLSETQVRQVAELLDAAAVTIERT